MHLKLPNNTILFHDNYKLKSVNELLDEVSQKTAFHEFEASVKKVKKLHPSLALNDLNILNLYYRDFYELYFTAKKMQTLITRVNSGEKITALVFKRSLISSTNPTGIVDFTMMHAPGSREWSRRWAMQKRHRLPVPAVDSSTSPAPS